jgi:hypothetical protein
MLSPEFERFYHEWLQKAELYTDDSIESCYDKFFTLFVVFNRLYAEATFELMRRGQISIQANRPLPDRRGATEFTLLFIGQAAFDLLYETELLQSVAALCSLIENEQFYIKLSSPNGERQREKDEALLVELRAKGKTRALAILDAVYSIRCNLFHGHKAFQEVQVDLLQPTIKVLRELIGALHRAHQANGAYP